MSCLGAKISAGLLLATMSGTAIAAVAGAETVVISWAALAGLYAQLIAFTAALIQIAECLESDGKQEDADRVRRQVEQLQREMDKLRSLQPQH